MTSHDFKDLDTICYTYKIKGKESKEYVVSNMEKAKQIIKMTGQDKCVYNKKDIYYINLDEKVICKNDMIYIRLNDNQLNITECINDVNFVSIIDDIDDVDNINEELFMYHFNIFNVNFSTIYAETHFVSYNEIKEYGKPDFEDDVSVVIYEAFEYIKNIKNIQSNINKKDIQKHQCELFDNPDELKSDYYVTNTGNIIISFKVIDTD